ncbi:MAG: Arm DNA-binding domain-containing protein [Desulfovibrionaceae bacterium]|nr:Arm DNA-binding domain-containing protein [Desulfovibrionaceae bacterium]
MPLSDAFIRAVKAASTAKKYADSGGLYLHVSPAGGKLWRMAYRFNGKQKTLSFGAWPAVSLKEARALPPLFTITGNEWRRPYTHGKAA